MILVSACLLGTRCRYNGGHCLRPQVVELVWRKGVIPICPEQLGGLATPRPPAEIVGGDGRDVLEGRARVLTDEGVDVTDRFIAGARECLELARRLGVTRAVLKARSPSCGVGQIYDGSFGRNLRPGDGVTAALLRSAGLEVTGDEEMEP